MSSVLTGARTAGTDAVATRFQVGEASLELSGAGAGVAYVRLATAAAHWDCAVDAEREAPSALLDYPGGWALTFDGLEATVQAEPLALTWKVGGAPLLTDHPTHAYARTGSLLRHRQVRADGERLLGLGEVSGALERSGRRYRLEPRDAMGYDAELSDPLYKHWPVLLLRRPEGSWAGLVYDVPFPMTFDLGAEIHNYLGPFRYVDVAGPGLAYYVVAAPDLPTLVERLTRLLGRPPLPPRWSLGYLASGMAYADADDPEGALLAFADRCAREGVPCTGIHLSSGYTLQRGRRYVFRWSPRIAHPSRLVGALAERGLHVIANVKPGLLEDHPDYRELTERGAFLRTAGGGPHVGDFWGGRGSFLDFTNEAARSYWRGRLRERLLDVGVEGVWNDNNEFAVEDAYAESGEPAHPASQMRGMALASYLACETAHPRRRPFVISRSASLGVQRLAQTWSGDNRTEWHALRFNTAMGLSLGLSGFANHGHDIGGFAGPAPDGELFLRWVQQGVFYPRFVIHSWKEPPTEPWSHPEVFPAVREALRLRHRLLPYLYSLFFQHVESGAPLMRPLFYHFDTPEAYERPFSFLLGPSLLVPGEAFAPGVREATVWLPGEDGWYRLADGGFHPSGVGTVPFPLELVPALARAGTVLPMAAAPTFGSSREARVTELRVFPHRASGDAAAVLYLDDGETLAYRRGERTVVDLRLHASPREIVVEAAAREAGYPVGGRDLTLCLPATETRPVRVGDGLRDLGVDVVREGWRRRTVRWALRR